MLKKNNFYNVDLKVTTITEPKTIRDVSEKVSR